MRSPGDLVRKFQRGSISRRDFVERAASGGLTLAATAAALKAQHKQDVVKRLRDPDQTNVNPFEEWLKQENLPVYRDYGIRDLRAIEVKPWKRMGTLGAYLDLKGGEGVNNAYVCEISPGGSTQPQRYLFEEVIYILSGEGESTIWNPGGHKQVVKWKPGSILGPPLNAWRQHFNRGTVPVRLLAITNAPVLIDLFHNADFVFNNDYVFRDRYNGEADEFAAGEDKLHQKKTTVESSEQRGGVYTWESDFIPNARTMGLAVSRERGAGNSRIELQLADNTMQAHISEFEVGTYKKAHRHGPGSHVVMLNGRGYTMMWKGSLKYSDAPEKERVDFIEGSIFVPPDGWFHQHFNTGPDPARYLAATWGGDGKWFMRSLGGGGRTHRLGKTSTRKGGNLIEYEDEDPAIRDIYTAELSKSGIQMKMPGKGKKS
jgi:gentisate 1,2-dioxygenase